MTSTSNKRRGGPSVFSLLVQSLTVLLLLHLLYRVLWEAYAIRLHALHEYGLVIHEFDPYFNYRATEYLHKHGWYKFRTWFDYKVWYPLGRPVGTTIYPGMQVTSVAIKNFILPSWSINDICCFVPAWFGVLATAAVAWLTYECVSESPASKKNKNKSSFTTIFMCIPFVRDVYKVLLKPAVAAFRDFVMKYTKSDWGVLVVKPVQALTPLACAVAAASIMSIVPAHLLRSVGGGYDNESIAMTAMVLTFACWTKSLKDYEQVWQTILWGCLAGVAYFNMVAAWGGYVFVLNVIGVHAGVLVLLGRYSTKLWISYSCFYVVGTALAVRVPCVGWTPLRSLEQMGPMAAFGGLQLLALSEYLVQLKQKKKKLTALQVWKLRLTVFLSAAAVGVLLVLLLLPRGYFGPISSRVRGLFVKHTKTGNPLVDSVAEHQAASPQAYFQYLNHVVWLVPLGFAMTALFFVSDSSTFLLVYGIAAYYFSHRMVRLILLTAPIASIFAGIVIGHVVSWTAASLAGNEAFSLWSLFTEAEDDSSPTDEGPSEATTTTSSSKKRKGKSSNNGAAKSSPDSVRQIGSDPLPVKGIRLMAAAYLFYMTLPFAAEFWKFAHEMAVQLSHPSIIQKAQTREGEMVIIDDYREAYFWLRDNTPEDSRIMAWWDYGYQITGMSERTTIADGNTWNHEHIAFLGRTLTAPEKEAHRIARHLADYVLVWAGGGGDDLAKSPHLRRIANSVFRGLCAEPTCQDFSFYSDRTPTPPMEESLLYKLVMNGVKPEVTVDPNRFREVYRTKYGKVRIYKVLSVSKESKEWVANPANRVCDAPGSWVCRGQYPPALEKILAEKRDFRQLEDFNVKDEVDSDYQQQYMENVLNPNRKVAEQNRRPENPEKPRPLTREDINKLNEQWENNEKTTLLWQLISENQVDQLKQIIEQVPAAVHIRSEDGRGPMWWAYEYDRKEIIQMLRDAGVSEKRTDVMGITPHELSK